MASEPLRSLSPTLRDLCQWFAKTGTPYVVIGGVAVSLLYRARTTKDVDALVLIDEETTATFVESGKPFGFIPRIAEAIRFARANRVLLLAHESDGVPVDISLAALAFERLAIQRANPVVVGGTHVRIPAVEDLIIMKAVASRLIDLADIDQLLNMHPNTDREYIRRAVTEFAELLDSPEKIEQLNPILAKPRTPPGTTI